MNKLEETAWKRIIKKDDRYSDFIIFDDSNSVQPFDKFFRDKNIELVQVHSIQVYGEGDDADIVGYVGNFSWQDNILKPLDGDPYNKEMLIYGYSWWSCPSKRIKNALDILVDEDW